ncbi:MAG: exosome complex protein Rrp4 [Candidatus Micrarchaeota archaeon]
MVDANSTRIVVPGEVLFEAPRNISYAYVQNGKTYSSVVGLFNEREGRLIPLQGAYTPLAEDVIIGVVKEVKFSGYVVEIKSPYLGFLSGKETRDEFQMGDILIARVKGADEVRNVDLTEAKRLRGGEIIEVASVKVPRVIGKKNSMLNMLRDATRSEILVGNNGRIWIKGGNSSLAARAILKIENEAHTAGLTDAIHDFLENELRNQNNR